MIYASMNECYLFSFISNKLMIYKQQIAPPRPGPQPPVKRCCALLQRLRNGKTVNSFINQALIMFTNNSHSLNKSRCTILQIIIRKVSPSPPIHNTCSPFIIRRRNWIVNTISHNNIGFLPTNWSTRK